VAVFPHVEESGFQIHDRDLVMFAIKGTGAGGQHINKTLSTIVCRHVPTGIEARAGSRSQHLNKQAARAVVEARVFALMRDQQAAAMDVARRKQIGSGMRADKIRTYREKDNLVIDHQSGRKANLKVVKSGRLDALLA
jgi:peptide chain release factor 1